MPMSDEPLHLAQRERRLVGELEEVQRELRDLFPPNTEPLSVDEPRSPTPLRKDERMRLHQRREELLAELDALRERRASGEL